MGYADSRHVLQRKFANQTTPFVRRWRLLRNSPKGKYSIPTGILWQISRRVPLVKSDKIPPAQGMLVFLARSIGNIATTPHPDTHREVGMRLSLKVLGLVADHPCGNRQNGFTVVDQALILATPL